MVLLSQENQPLTVGVWLLPLSGAHCADIFSEEDRERGRRFRHQADSLRASLSNRLLRHGAAELLGSAPEKVRIGRWCPTCHRMGDHGRPVVMDEGGGSDSRIHLSASHGGEWVAVAASSSVDVGIDIEPCSRTLSEETDSLVLSASEQEELARLPAESRGTARLTTWVRKEAVLKATGLGLGVEPALLVFSGDRVVGYPDRLAPHLGGGVQVFDTPVVGGHLTALAVLTASHVDITVHPTMMA